MKVMNIMMVLCFAMLIIGCEQSIRQGCKLKCLLPDGVNYVQLIDSGMLPHHYYYRALPFKKTGIIIDGYCMIVDGADCNFFDIPIQRQPFDMHWDDSGGCLFSDSNCIYRIDTLGCSSVLLKTQRSLVKFDCNSTTGVYYYHENDSSLYFFSYKYNDNLLLFTFPSSIRDLKLDGNDCYIASGKEVILLTSVDEMYTIFVADEMINSIELGTAGTVFYATNELVGYFDYRKTTFSILAKGAVDLLINRNSLYLTFADNGSARIDSISAYYDLASSVSK